MPASFVNVLLLFVIGFGAASVVTRRRRLATRVQAAIVLGLVLAFTPLVVGQIAR